MIPKGHKCASLRLAHPNLTGLQVLFKGQTEHGALLQDVLESSGLTIKNVDIAYRLIENFKKIAVDQIIEHQDTVNLPAITEIGHGTRFTICFPKNLPH